MADNQTPSNTNSTAQASGSISTPILQPPDSFQIRTMLEDLVVKDLLGPAGGPEEELPPNEDRVIERYLVGMLAPKKVAVDPSSLDDIAVAGEDTPEEGKPDLPAAQSGTMFPSSMGMTFAVDLQAEALIVKARWGKYKRIKSAVYENPKTGNPENTWIRQQIEGITAKPIPLRDGFIAPWFVSEEFPEVNVQGRMRRHSTHWIVTLFLVNGQPDPKRNKDEAWLFQPELIVESPDKNPVFVRRLKQSANLEKMDAIARMESQAMGMLYRWQVEFAVGHSVGVHATLADADPQRAVRLATSVIPSYEVPKSTPPLAADNPELANVTLDMKILAGLGDQELAKSLVPLADSYEAWIDREEQRKSNPSERLDDHLPAVDDALVRCRTSLNRIREGINLIAKSHQAADSFRFANQTMWKQRIRSIFAKQIRKGERTQDQGDADIDVAKNRSWYPFQLAFILLNLSSATDLHHKDRSHPTEAICDLLWFPTGGGKTEAYLGLAAYMMALRRLQGEIEERSGQYGVAVLMRYTLRLLTLQQFQRATTLICACEMIRRENMEKWGTVPFRIGLWVGMKATPNTTSQALDAITQTRGARGIVGSGTPAQLTSCPWCGTSIDPGQHIKVRPGMADLNRTFLFCGDPLGMCPFSEGQSPTEGVPALVVDEEIYRNPPSLLIATVDKFAQMPWKGEVQMLFGQVNARCDRHGFCSPETEDSSFHPARGGLPAVRKVAHAPLRPPDLIIQDELHLISGPLGSMVGLYETAVDNLCSWTVNNKKVRPKVIASTATIRRAETQVHKLFLRQLQVFPPHGTDIKDNFFSLQREPSDSNPGRLYLGVCALGRRYPAILIRVYVALLAAAKKLYDQYNNAVDPWMTLAGYFNSMRELGGTRRLVEDDISSRLRDADQRGLAKRRQPYIEELTSRKSGKDIPGILDRLDIGFNLADEAKRKAQRKAGQKVDPPDPLDVILATNMISVGVDVDRLGLMVVAGQPKNTAEYIQATSRVGRKWPGLVLTVYNWARPRDLSHYETFEHYHTTFYQHVEALSVTPFAPRALDRGLSGVMVSMIRLAREELNANIKAGELTRDHELLLATIESIAERAANVEGKKSAGDYVKQMLAERRDLWMKRISDSKNPDIAHILGYRDGRDGATKGLLKMGGKGEWERFTCLNSLRDVEPSIHLILTETYGMAQRDVQDNAGPDSGQGGT